MSYYTFDNWEDVQRSFQMNEPEPSEVILASYDIDGYEGSATVIYRNKRRYYYVSGAHCSCYGLEEQWEPEEFQTKASFRAFIERRHPDWIRSAVLEHLDK